MHFLGPCLPTHIHPRFFLHQSQEAHDCCIVLFSLLSSFPSHHQHVTLFVPMITLRKRHGEGTLEAATSRLFFFMVFSLPNVHLAIEGLLETSPKIRRRKNLKFLGKPHLPSNSFRSPGWGSGGTFLLICSAS